MKNQNPKNKLAFNKAAVTELNSNQLETVNGGTSTTTISTTSLVTISVPRRATALSSRTTARRTCSCTSRRWSVPACVR